mmetsp:Transcript_15985/g.35576  ORF Transcript_15985/g.35576 Transcript_15985/m.35576 type:complete len:298 (+) Transcript_15985:634-1527(+)
MPWPLPNRNSSLSLSPAISTLRRSRASCNLSMRRASSYLIVSSPPPPSLSSASPCCCCCLCFCRCCDSLTVRSPNSRTGSPKLRSRAVTSAGDRFDSSSRLRFFVVPSRVWDLRRLESLLLPPLVPSTAPPPPLLLLSSLSSPSSPALLLLVCPRASDDDAGSVLDAASPLLLLRGGRPSSSSRLRFFLPPAALAPSLPLSRLFLSSFSSCRSCALLRSDDLRYCLLVLLLPPLPLPSSAVLVLAVVETTTTSLEARLAASLAAFFRSISALRRSIAALSLLLCAVRFNGRHVCRDG